MTASAVRICRITYSASVTAGLKWAPETTASVCTSMNRASRCTKPITEKSMNGWSPPTGGLTYRLTVMVMKKTSANVPMNSATYAAGPLSGRSDMTVPPLSGRITRRGYLSHRSQSIRPKMPRRMRVRIGVLIAVGALVIAGCGGGGGGGSSQPKPVTVALDFTPNGVHAGLYAAVAKG